MSEEHLQGDGGSRVAAYQEGRRLCGSNEESDKAAICVGCSVELTQRSEQSRTNNASVLTHPGLSNHIWMLPVSRLNPVFS